MAWVFHIRRLAIPYFRMANCHTIIGTKRFHFRVRDGVGWFTLAMVTKQFGVAEGLISAQCPGPMTKHFSVYSPRPALWKSVVCSANALAQTDWVLYGQASRAISTR